MMGAFGPFGLTGITGTALARTIFKLSAFIWLLVVFDLHEKNKTGRVKAKISCLINIFFEAIADILWG